MASMEERNRRLSSKHSIHSSTNGTMRTGSHPHIAGSRGIAQIATAQHDDDELASPGTCAPAN